MIESLPAWGVWIEIQSCGAVPVLRRSRSPHGECGLKSGGERDFICEIWSLPAWGVWIEIYESPIVEISGILSLPAWGVWIEIPSVSARYIVSYVAPRMGSVD